ncbi:MAG: S8 family serine peptidase [Proteobacteria bacterium]|nr:S8 family serine peptidase [Pseudomonadota bacterium]
MINAKDVIASGSYTGAGVVIGLLDTGVNRNHPSLAGRVIANFTNVSGVDTSVDDKVGHGTTVASLAAGKAVGNWPGGVAQGASIISSRIIADEAPKDDGSGQGNEVQAGRGYGEFFRALNLQIAEAAARAGAVGTIINNSWGGLYWTNDQVTNEFVNAWSDFILNRDGLVVFANGNSGTDARYRDNPSNNAALPSKSAEAAFLERGWLTVAALNPTESTPTLTDYSQACGVAKNYCLTAPGNVVFTGHTDTSGSTSYKWGGGTSYAAPLVSGTAALVWQAFPYFNNDLVRQTVLGTATDIGDPGPDAIFGYGLLNVGAAVKGPGRFDWGDVLIEFDNKRVDPARGVDVSYFRNPISGSGGLIKAGSGTLVLTERGSYQGATVLRQGGLNVLQGLASSSVTVEAGTRFQGVGSFGGSVTNGASLIAGDGVNAMNIAGDFTNYWTGPAGDVLGTLHFWLGNPLGVDGKAKLTSDSAGNSKLHVEGVKSGYVFDQRTMVIYTKEGLLGRFDNLVTSASNVTLVNYTLEYDLLNAYLRAQRVDVRAAASIWGLSALSQGAASRMEGVMGGLDGSLGGALPGGTGGNIGLDADLLAAAGAFQQAPSVAGVDVSLRSLSGQLHGTASAMTFESIDANRRAATSRFDRFRGNLRGAGAWAADLSRDGGLSLSGFDSVDFSSSGEIVGHDVAYGANTLFGMAFSRQRQQSWLPAMGDRMRGYQYESQLYAAWLSDGWYAQGRLGIGQFDRQMQRNVLLGTSVNGVATRLSGDYFTANMESGRGFGLAGGTLTPYLGVDYTRLDNDGFSEAGAGGLGLRADQWNSTRTQGYLGLRGERSWRLGNGVTLALDARGEYQERLQSAGEVFDASFVGFEQWQPLYGIGLAARSRLYQMGLTTSFSARNLFRVDYSRRQSDRYVDDQVNLQYSHAF